MHYTYLLGIIRRLNMSRLQFSRQPSNATTVCMTGNNGSGGHTPVIEHTDMITRYGVSNPGAVSTHILNEDHDIGMQDINFPIHESLFERPLNSHLIREDSNGFHTRTRSPITVHSITSSEGSNIRIMSEPQHLLTSNDMDSSSTNYNRRWHHHAQDVSLAAPSNRPFWHQPKSNPLSSATPPSQFLGFYGPDTGNTVANNDITSLVGAGSTHSQPSSKLCQPTPSPSPSSMHSNTSIGVRNQPYVEENRTFDSIQGNSSFYDRAGNGRSCMTIGNSPGLDGICEMDRLFSENEKPFIPRNRTVISSFIDSQRNKSPGVCPDSTVNQLVNFNGETLYGTANAVFLTSSVTSAENSFVSSNNYIRSDSNIHSNDNEQKFKTIFCSPTTSISNIVKQDPSHSDLPILSSRHSLNSSPEYYLQHRPQNLVFKHSNIPCLPTYNCNQPIDYSESRNGHKQPTDDFANTRNHYESSTATPNTGNAFREIMIEMKGIHKNYKIYHGPAVTSRRLLHQPVRSPIVMENMFVPLSKRRRISLPGTDELFLSTEAARYTPTNFSDRSPTPTFLPSPVENTNDYLRDAFVKSENGDLKHVKSEFLLDNSMESMKTFWSNPKAATLDQLYNTTQVTIGI